MEKIIKNMARSIGVQLGYDEEKINVIAYGLSAFAQAVILCILIVTAGLILKIPGECIIIFIGAGLLRRSIGGAHSDTYLGCIIISTAMIVALGLLSGYVCANIPTLYFVIGASVVHIITLLAIYKYAPVDTPNKPITSPEKIKRLRKCGFATEAVYILLTIILLISKLPQFAAAVTLSAAWQCFVITPIGHNFISFINSVPKKFKREKEI